MVIVEHEPVTEDIYPDDPRFKELYATEFIQLALREEGPELYVCYLTLMDGILIGATLNYVR